MTEAEVEYIIKENEIRNKLLSIPYDPIKGIGGDCCERRLLKCSGLIRENTYLPIQAFNDPVIKKLQQAGSVAQVLHNIGKSYTKENVLEINKQYIKARIKYDFEFWCAMFATIKDKKSERDIKFVLNRGQRKLLKVILKMWFEEKPIRIILCKARQWGGSTLIQIFMIWVQLVHYKQWNSVIAAHKENTSKVIRGMYSKLLKNYPHWLLGNSESLKLTPFEGSQKTRELKERSCKITIGSAEQPNSILGDDVAMAHLSEVGLWKTSDGKKPEDLAQSVYSGILDMKATMIAIESTARGVGNYFHREWIRANKPIDDKEYSGFTPVFVAWTDIDMYKSPIKHYKKFVNKLTEEEFKLFKMGATLEGLKWRRDNKRKIKDEWRFKMEFPTTAEEAFQSTGHRFHPTEDILELRKGCCDPKFIGEIYGDAVSGVNSMNNIKFKEEDRGCLKVWSMPNDELVRNRYLVVVDIGGTSETSDRSVICVFDRYWLMHGGLVEVVAEWCGHVDHDILAWKAVQLAKAYNDALLIIESNKFEANKTEGDHFDFILDEIGYYYDNLYSRVPADKIKEGAAQRYGFHTNRQTKPIVCNYLKAAIREGLYYEPCVEACDEMDTFEVKPNGSTGAVEGCHDDRYITRAIGVWAAYTEMDPPVKYEKKVLDDSFVTADYVGLSSF